MAPPQGAALWPGAHEIGTYRGQAWEQFNLPGAARRGILINPGNTAPLLARRQIVVIHDAGVYSTPEAYSWKFRTWYKLLQNILIRRNVPVATVSEFSRAEILRHLPARPEQVSVIPEGADHVGRIMEDETTLPRFGLERGRFVLAVGNLAAHKNLPALGPLAIQLRARQMRLVVAGNVLGRAFSAGGQQLLPDAAHYIGRVTDAQLKALFQAASCFVFPSRYEGYGLPVMEAMASACPVVAADIPALRETCGGAALYCDPSSPDHIAQTVLQLCDSQNLQAQRRTAGQHHVASLTWARAALALQDIIIAHYGGKA